MGKRKYLDKIERLFEKSPIVDFKSIERIVGKRKNSSYAKLLIINLLKKSRIFRLTKGFYTKYRDISLLVFCFKPAYLGLQSALSYHGLWEQETMPVILTSKSVRQGIRKSIGGNVNIRRLDKNYLFGFNYFKEGEFYIPYSDVEKTFIDMVFFKQNVDKDILVRIKKKINRKKLESYLKRYSPDFRRKVMRIIK